MFIVSRRKLIKRYKKKYKQVLKECKSYNNSIEVLMNEKDKIDSLDFLTESEKVIQIDFLNTRLDDLNSHLEVTENELQNLKSNIIYLGGELNVNQ